MAELRILSMNLSKRSDTQQHRCHLVNAASGDQLVERLDADVPKAGRL